MKKFLILILLLPILINCGPEDNCKYDLINGLCLNSQDFPVFREAVSMTIDITENEVNKEYPGLDLPWLSEANSLEATYMYKGTLGCKHDDNSKIRGCYLIENESILVNYLTPDEAPSANLRCREAYYVLGHELLHFILNYHTNASHAESLNHTHSVFMDFQKTENGVTTLVEGVETRMYFAIASMCKDMFGIDY